MTDDLAVTLTRMQSRVYRDPTRFKVCICGRRGTKTFLGNAWLIEGAVTKPKSVNWYVGPILDDARDLFYEPVLDLLPRELVASHNRTRYEIVLVNGSVLRGLSEDKAKRGHGVDRLVCDEFAWWADFSEVWQAELRPALSDRQGKAMFLTTPAGYNWAYDLFMRSDQPDWASWSWTTVEGGYVTQAEVDAARADYTDPRIFRQEYEASFEALSGRVYDCFDRAPPDGNVDPSIEDKGAEILVGMDFNINPMSAVIAVKMADECHVLDSLEIQTSNTEEMAVELETRYPGRTIIVCPDPSGKARKTCAPGGVTDFTILERHGFAVHAPSKAPLVRDRINNTQAVLLAGERRRLKVHPRAKHLIKALDGLCYKPDTNQPDKSSGLDHVTDALGYLLWQEFNVLESRKATIKTHLY